MQKKTTHPPITLENINVSLATIAEMVKVHELLKGYKVSLCKITPSGKLVLYDFPREDLNLLEYELDNILSHSKVEMTKQGPNLISIRCCPEGEICRFSVADSKNLARKINGIKLKNPPPHKVKIAVSGCQMCCVTPMLVDIGVMANRRGWTLFFGGNAGRKPRIGDEIARNLNDEQVVDRIEKLLIFYSKYGSKRQRTARFVEKIGIAAIKEIFFD